MMFQTSQCNIKEMEVSEWGSLFCFSVCMCSGCAVDGRVMWCLEEANYAVILADSCLLDYLEQESFTAHPTPAGLSEPSLNTSAGG